MTSMESKGTALVTGASSGIGAIYADRLARRGYDLILVARNRQRLVEVARSITEKTRRAIEVVAADLNEQTDIARVETLLRSDSSITMLVNNAGVGSTAPLLESDIEQMAHLITLNVTALTRLVYSAVPGFVARGNGTIINIASIAALAPEMLNGVYGASKAFVLTLSLSLQHELAGKGVRVQAVLPGAIATEFWDIAGMPIQHLPPGIVMTTDNLVDAALAGLDLGERVTIPSLPSIADWEAYEAARRALGPGLSRDVPAKRYTA
ncbi:MAG: putative oxidoreductase [Gammaproteobacteria bacterium]|nr:putative oxidoreductase [Gammaproteobacteria bacterium]